MVKDKAKTSPLQLYHTEYDNPRDRVSIVPALRPHGCIHFI